MPSVLLLLTARLMQLLRSSTASTRCKHMELDVWVDGREKGVWVGGMVRGREL